MPPVRIPEEAVTDVYTFYGTMSAQAGICLQNKKGSYCL